MQKLSRRRVRQAALEVLESRRLFDAVINVADINTNTSDGPQEFIRNGNILWGAGNASGPLGANSASIVRYDTTTGASSVVGSSTVRGINVYNTGGSYANSMATVGAGVVFNAGIYNAAGFYYDYEPYFTDGTVANTRRLADLNPNQASTPQNFTRAGSLVYFTATDGINNNQLYVTDGTSAGTQPVFNPADPNAGLPVGASIYNLRSVGNTLLIFATIPVGSGGSEYALFGMPAGGTSPVKLNPANTTATGSLSLASTLELSGILFYPGNASATGTEIYSTDGTVAGTHLVTDFTPGVNGTSWGAILPFDSTRALITIGSQPYFLTANSITPLGTGSMSSSGVGTGIIDYISNSADLVLKRYNASTNTSASVYNFAAIGTTSIAIIAAVGTRSLLRVVRSSGAVELWKSDGTFATTSVLGTTTIGTYSRPIATINSSVYLPAYTSSIGGELFRSDGTLSGSGFVDLNNATASSSAGSSSGLVNANGTLFFTAFRSDIGTELFKSNGTAAGTSLVSDTVAGATGGTFTGMAAIGSNIIFTRVNGSNVELWKSDGTAAGTAVFTTVTPVGGTDASYFNYIGTAGGYYYFALQTSTNQFLYRTDGTAAGTINLNIYGATGFAVVGSSVYTTGYKTGDVSRSLYKTDGTVAGTTKPFNATASSYLYGTVTAAGTNVYFPVYNSSLLAMYRTDGTTTGQVNGWTPNSGIYSVVGTLGNQLVVYGRNATTGSNYYLYVTTAAGALTQLTSTASAFASFPQNTGVQVGTRMVFTANDSTTGVEPWVTDGTLAGTGRLSDLVAGNLSSSPQYYTLNNGRLYFAAAYTVIESPNTYFYNDLFSTDGTTAGTRLEPDITPFGSTSPSFLTSVNNVLYFDGYTPLLGNELFALVPDAPPTATLNAITPNPRSSPLATATFVFSELVTGFDLGDIQLTRGGVDVPLAGTATLSSLDGITYTLSGLTALTSTPGAYLLSIRAIGTGIIDATSNALAGTASAAFTVGESTAPTASLTASTAPAGAASFDFTVTYTDASGIDATSLGSSNLIVNGPSSYEQPATFISATPTGNGSPIVATYRITNLPLAAGQYTVRIVANQVKDAAPVPNYIPAGSVGTFLATDITPPSVIAATLPTITVGQTTATITVTYADNIAVDATTFGNNDVRVSGPNGYNVLATYVSTTAVSGGTKISYTITGPGGDFSADDTGTYAVRVEAGSVADTSGNGIAVALLGSFWVPDLTAPSANTGTYTSPSLGSPSYTFDVVYSDNVGIDLGTLDNADVRVTGPGGYSQLATFVGTSNSAGASPLTVTYSIAAPGGSWDEADAGTYTLAVVAGQVKDTNANVVPATTLGTFAFSADTTAPLATASASNVIIGTPLTPYRFNVTYSDSAFKPASLGNDDVTITSTGRSPMTANFVSVASSGTTHVATYELNVPGGSWDSSEQGDYLVGLNFGAVTDLAGNPAPAGNLAGFRVDLRRPTGVLTAANVTAVTSGNYNFSVAWADNLPGNLQGIGTGDVRVTGPGGFNQLATYVSSTGSGNAITANYRITPAGGGFGVNNSGTYSVSVEPAALTDLAGNSTSATQLGNFAVVVPGATLPTPRTFSYGGSPLNLLDVGSTQIATMGISGQPSPISAAKVHLNITHTYTYDIGAVLVSPTGKRIQLLIQNGYNANGIDFVFDDSASSSVSTIPSAEGPKLTGTYRPLQSLATLLGDSPNGTWTLEYTDQFTGDSSPGTLLSWELLFTLPSSTSDLSGPAATLFTPSVNDASNGATAYDFTVTYTDSGNVVSSLIDGNDITILTPGGQVVAAALQSKTSSTDSALITATYRFTPRGGSWITPTQASIRFSSAPTRFGDGLGNYATPGLLGSFSANIAPPATVTIPAGGITVPTLYIPAGTTVTFNGTGTFTVSGALTAEPGGSLVIASGTAVINGTPVTGGTYNTGALPGLLPAEPPAGSLVSPTARRRGRRWVQINGDATFSRFKGRNGSTTVVTAGTDATILTGSFDLESAANFDLKNNRLAIDYTDTDPAATLRGLIASAYAGGAWTGNGLTSSLIASTPFSAIGFGEATDVLGIAGGTTGTFGRTTVDASTLLVKLTLRGDANLDGTVDTRDFAKLVGGFGRTNSVFSRGDFNYDGLTDSVDFGLFATAYGRSMPATPGALPRAAAKPATPFGDDDGDDLTDLIA